MFVNFIVFIFSISVTLSVWGNCYEKDKLPGVSRHVIDLSDKFDSDGVYYHSHETNFPSSYVFECATSTKLLYRNSLGEPQVVLFQGGKYYIEVSLLDFGSTEVEVNSGQVYSGGNFNRTVKMKFALKPYGGWFGTSDGSLEAVLFVITDESALGFPWNLARWLYNIFTWGSWRHDNGDIFHHRVKLVYNPKQTTCMLDNSSGTIVLPSVGLAQVKSAVRPGYKEFALGLSCEQLATGGASSRGIDMFLSSNNLSASSNTVLHDSRSGSASGVGIQLVRAEAPDQPVVISRSSTVRGNATSLFRVAKGEALKDRFTIKMGAYYHVVDKNKVSAGEINTSAMLNIVYD